MVCRVAAWTALSSISKIVGVMGMVKCSGLRSWVLAEEGRWDKRFLSAVTISKADLRWTAELRVLSPSMPKEAGVSLARIANPAVLPHNPGRASDSGLMGGSRSRMPAAAEPASQGGDRLGAGRLAGGGPGQRAGNEFVTDDD